MDGDLNVHGLMEGTFLVCAGLDAWTVVRRVVGLGGEQLLEIRAWRQGEDLDAPPPADRFCFRIRLEHVRELMLGLFLLGLDAEAAGLIPEGTIELACEELQPDDAHGSDVAGAQPDTPRSSSARGRLQLVE